MDPIHDIFYYIQKSKSTGVPCMTQRRLLRTRATCGLCSPNSEQLWTLYLCDGEGVSHWGTVLSSLTGEYKPLISWNREPSYNILEAHKINGWILNIQYWCIYLFLWHVIKGISFIQFLQQILSSATVTKYIGLVFSILRPTCSQEAVPSEMGKLCSYHAHLSHPQPKQPYCMQRGDTP